MKPYCPSPRNRVITEYELLGALVKNDSAEQIVKLKSLAFGNILNSKNYAKQFGNTECKPISNVSKIVNHQFLSLNQKFKRTESSNAFDYKKPGTPTRHRENIVKINVLKKKNLNK